MDNPFTKYTSPDTETLDQYETLDEFETNGPFSHAHHDHESSGEYEASFPETESDQFSYEDGEQQREEENFSGDYESAEHYNPLSELEIAQEIEHQVEIANESKPAKKPQGKMSWAKEALNRVLGLSLPDNNNTDSAASKAIADFQSKNNLPATQKLDPVTERALLEAVSIARSKGTDLESATLSIITAAKSKIEDWTKKAVNNKPQHILNDYRDPRKIFAFVLHHMAFKRWNPKTKGYSNPESYLSTGAHFCIMLDGRIIQLHAMSRMIWHGNCASGGSVAVEFEGNFPNINGKWWIDKESTVQHKDTPTQAQYDSGRFLTSYLKTVLPITRIMAHRQSSKSRENDPGPDVWFNVGQWAIEKLGLSDGGDKAKCGDGSPILSAWRTWGNKTAPKPASEFNDEMEMEEHECHECNQRKQAAERYDSEHDHESDYTPQSENEFEQNDESTYAYEGESLYEAESRDWSEAVRANRKYAKDLKWDVFYDKINDMLLPLSGMSNVSLGEEAFAAAVFEWQRENGFRGNNIDGVIGPKTWEEIQKKLKIKVSSTSTKPVAKNIGPGGGVYTPVRKGWKVSESGSLRDKLFQLNNSKIVMSPDEIEMFLLVSKRESDQQVNVVNSYDSVYMSVGFLQLTLPYELASLIKLAPHAFQKYGIELDLTRKYFKNSPNSFVIKNAPTPDDLRSREWAERFYQAGLEDDVIIAQVKFGRQTLQKIRTFDKNKYLDRFNDRFPKLWALIYESHNSRPAPFRVALTNATHQASIVGINDPVSFAKMLIEHIKTSTAAFYGNSKNVSYKNDEEKRQRIIAELAKVSRIVEATGILK